jgi:hypothetical protein
MNRKEGDLRQVDRRSLVKWCAASLPLVMAPSLASAQEQTGGQGDAAEDPYEGLEALDPLPADYTTGISKPDFKLSGFYGSAPPPEVYKQVGRAILTGAPVRCRPIDVAYYFNNVRMGILTPDVAEALEDILRKEDRLDLLSPDFFKLFAYDWERNHYYNPVVVQFIAGIGQQPYLGDATPWCAAFANWCISRSQSTNPSFVSYSGTLLGKGTRSASSGSFRCWGEPTSSPREGDVVVWAKLGSEKQSCPVDLNNAQGHVGFYAGAVVRANGRKAYRVLGGNQGFIADKLTLSGSGVRQRDIAQAVSYRTMGEQFSDRTFHSIRTSSLLRGDA